MNTKNNTAQAVHPLKGRPIYMDYNSTTPTDPRVWEAMKPFFLEYFGNAASRTHAYGWEAEEAVEIAREHIAKLIGSPDKKNIIFTSGATEANNMVIKGIVHAAKAKPVHVITQKTEHKCVLESCQSIEKEGHEVTYLDVDKYGRIDPQSVKNAIKPNTILVSIMTANNEIGTIQPIAEIAAVVHAAGVLFHTDAAQAVGKIPLDVEKMGIDLMSLSAHKIYGPKGVGALYIAKRRPPIRLAPMIHGGGHERGKRSGTLPVPLIVGFGEACRLAELEMPAESKRLGSLRDRFIAGIFAELDHVYLNGHPTERLPNNINFSFEFVEGESLIMGMPELAVSSGSACTSASLEPSYIIRALGVNEELAHSSIRYSIGRWTTEADIDIAIQAVAKAVKRLRDMSPLYEMAQKGIKLSEIQWTAGDLSH